MGEGKGSREIHPILVKKEGIFCKWVARGIDERCSPERACVMEGRRVNLAFDSCDTFLLGPWENPSYYPAIIFSFCFVIPS